MVGFVYSLAPLLLLQHVKSLTQDVLNHVSSLGHLPSSPISRLLLCRGRALCPSSGSCCAAKAVSAETLCEPGRGLPILPLGLCSFHPKLVFRVDFFFSSLHLRSCSPALGEEPPRKGSFRAAAFPCSALALHPRRAQQDASACRAAAASARPAGTSPTCSRGWAKAPRAEVPPAEVPLPSRASKCSPFSLWKPPWEPGGRMRGGLLISASPLEFLGFTPRTSLFVEQPESRGSPCCPQFWWALCSSPGVSVHPRDVQGLSMSLEHWVGRRRAPFRQAGAVRTSRTSLFGWSRLGSMARQTDAWI